MNFILIYLYIKFKRPNINKDLLIQLSVQTIIEFTKYSYKDYDLNILVLIINIYSNNQNLYLIYTRIDKYKDKDFFIIQFIDLIKIDNTTNLRNIFRILRFLYKYVDQGLELYKIQFRKKVLELYKFIILNYS